MNRKGAKIAKRENFSFYRNESSPKGIVRNSGEQSHEYHFRAACCSVDSGKQGLYAGENVSEGVGQYFAVHSVGTIYRDYGGFRFGQKHASASHSRTCCTIIG